MIDKKEILRKCKNAVDHGEPVMDYGFYFAVIDMLKEQEPKAIEYHDNPFTGLPVAHCPNCKKYAIQFYTAVEEEAHYCLWCGQAVKWNG